MPSHVQNNICFTDIRLLAKVCCAALIFSASFRLLLRDQHAVKFRGAGFNSNDIKMSGSDLISDTTESDNTELKELAGRIWSKKWSKYLELRSHIQVRLDEFGKTGKVDCQQQQERCAYDYIEPDWNCEMEVRFGEKVFSPGDGPKFVCGVEILTSRRPGRPHSLPARSA